MSTNAISRRLLVAGVTGCAALALAAAGSIPAQALTGSSGTQPSDPPGSDARVAAAAFDVAGGEGGAAVRPERLRLQRHDAGLAQRSALRRRLAGGGRAESTTSAGSSTSPGPTASRTPSRSSGCRTACRRRRPSRVPACRCSSARTRNRESSPASGHQPPSSRDRWPSGPDAALATRARRRRSPARSSRRWASTPTSHRTPTSTSTR